MKKLNIIICLLASLFTYAQEKSVVPVTEGVLTLDQRFQLMKSRGQSYNEYKVIKEVVLDGVWKITSDSIRKFKSDIRMANARITQLEIDMKSAQDKLKQKELSVADITFDSIHISVLGIPFTKGVFLVVVAALLGGLVVTILTLLGAMRVTRSSLKERMLTVDLISKEYDEYKKKALDKETKILRQLQDERNKYHASAR